MAWGGGWIGGMLNMGVFRSISQFELWWVVGWLVVCCWMIGMGGSWVSWLIWV